MDAQDRSRHAVESLRAAWRGPAPEASHRALFVGKPGSGKSQLAAVMFSMVRSRRVVIDVKKGAIEVDDDGTGVCYAEDGPDSIIWRDHRTLVYRPQDPGDMDEMNELYKRVFAMESVTTWLDESVGPTTSYSRPPMLRTLLVQGRSKRLRHYAMAQRAANIETFLYDTADQVVVAGSRGVALPDIKKLADDWGEDPKKMRRHVAQMRHNLGDWSYMHYDGKTIHLRPPLPRWMVDACPVHIID